MDDRRRHVRYKSTTIMQYKQGLFSGDVDTLTKDVGLGGACFFSSKKLKLGMELNVKLFYDNKVSARAIKGRIVWSTPYQGGTEKGYLNGLMFIRT